MTSHEEENAPEDRGGHQGSERAAAHGFKRIVLLAAGWLTAGLALVGVMLPVLPTTPFLLVAAACFLRSSPTLHKRLLNDRRFGPYLRQWDHDRSIPARAKRRAYAVVAVTFSISIWFVDAAWLRFTLAGLGIGVIVLLVMLRTTGESDAP
jgi:hypothetical protein